MLKCTHSSSGIKFELYSGQSKKLVAVVVVVVTEKPEIHFPGPAVRAMKGLWLECSATGTPPIQITINQNGTQLVKGTGFAKVRIADEGEYRCTARNEAGTDSKEIIVSFPTSKCNHPYEAIRILSSGFSWQTANRKPQFAVTRLQFHVAEISNFRKAFISA